MYVIAALLGVLAVAPFAVELFRLDGASRRTPSSGRRLALSRGRTYLREFGPKDGAPYILVHGLTTPSFVFDALVPHLVARGHRVLTYDHYGRGFSDRPRAAQDGAFFCEHLVEILDAVGIDHPVPMLGYSMGGAVVTDFAARHPDRVAALVLVAPGGMKADLGGLTRQAMLVPGLGDWLMHGAYPALHRAATEAERALDLAIPDVIDRQQEELHYRGFIRSVLSSIRGLLAWPLQAEHLRIAKNGIPVTAIWGATDAVIPVSCRDMLAQWNPQADHVVVPDAGHGLVYTHVDALVAAIP